MRALAAAVVASFMIAAPVRAQTAPAIATGVALGISSITWTWTPTTVGATGYRVLNSSTGANLSGDLSAATSVYVLTGLTTNTTYGIMVEGFAAGVFAVDSATSTVSTYADQPTGLQLNGLNAPSFSNDSTNESASWNANTNPAGTNYNVLWWTNVTSTVTVSTGTNSAVVGGLVGGATIFFTVQARNLDGIATAYDPSFYAVAPSTFFPAASQLLPVGFAGGVTFAVPNAGGTGAGVVSVVIASGTFASAVTLTVSTPAATAPGFSAIGAGLADLASPIHLTITANDGSGNPQQPLRPILITMTYAASNFASATTAVDIARFDASRNLWIPLATTRHGSTLSAVTDHLSSFAALTVAASSTGLSAVTVGPNPFRPVINPGTLMTFRNMPAGARLRIFSYVGERIVDVDADGSGVFGWDGRNRGGGNVASGVYIVVIEGGGEKRTLRVAIER